MTIEVQHLRQEGQLKYERFLQKERSYHYQTLENQSLSIEQPEPIMETRFIYLQRVDRKALELDERVRGVEKALGNHVSYKKKRVEPF